MNLGFKCAQGKYVCMLSDDCLVVPGALKHGVELFDAELSSGKHIGSVAFYWRNWPEQERYWVGLTLGNKMFVNHGLYLRSALEGVGFAEEEDFVFYHADGDLCLKMWREGFECICSENSFIEHYSHANLKVRQDNRKTREKDWSKYLEKWEGIFYHPEENDMGDWLFKDHNDPHLTARLFKKADRFKWRLRQLSKVARR